MKSPVRVTGLLVFLALFGFLFGALVLLLDPLLARVIQTTGSEAIGAKVELESAETSIIEQKFALRKLAVTDPRAPMFNLFELFELVMDIDGDALLWNKWVVDELTIKDLYLNTPRAESGEYKSRWLRNSEWNPLANLGGFEDIGLDDLPDPNEIATREALQTPAAVEAFKNKVSQTKTTFEKRLNELPDENTIGEYEKRLKDIKQQSKGGNKLLGVLSQGKELKELQQNIKADIERVKSLKRDLETARSELGQDLKTLREMPGNDFKRLKAKYSLSGNGVNEIVSSLFGEQIGGWAQTGWHYYQMVSPYLNSYNSSTDQPDVKVSPRITNLGRKVLFEDQHPLPNYLIKKAHLSSNLQDYGIALSGLIENLTTEPERWSEPMKLDLTGESGFLKTFDIKGLFDHRSKETSQDKINIIATGINLINLSQQQSTPSNFSIEQGIVDVKADILRQGASLDGTLQLTFNGLSIKAEQQQAWQQKLVSGINSLGQLALTIKLSGDINQPDISIKSSDLATIGSAVVREMASDKLAEFESSLQQTINDKTSGLLADVGNTTDFSGIQEQLNLTEANLSELLKIN